MKIVAIMILIFVGITTIANAQMLLLHVGAGGFSSTPAVNCGTGVIDLSTGCPQPMLR